MSPAEWDAIIIMCVSFLALQWSGIWINSRCIPPTNAGAVRFVHLDMLRFFFLNNWLTDCGASLYSSACLSVSNGRCVTNKHINIICLCQVVRKCPGDHLQEVHPFFLRTSTVNHQRSTTGSNWRNNKLIVNYHWKLRSFDRWKISPNRQRMLM